MHKNELLSFRNHMFCFFKWTSTSLELRFAIAHQYSENAVVDDMWNVVVDGADVDHDDDDEADVCDG